MSDYMGKTIGEYQLIELLAENAQTLQIKAFQPGKDRYVNFTMLKPHAARDALFVQQFLNAAEIAAGMAHNNIMPVLDFGQQDDVVYRISPLAESGTVNDHLTWFYDLPNASQLLSRINDGLAYLYARGHIHGNLQSSNIYIDAALQPKLAGFGISQPPGHAENPYMSPEQIRGGVVDQRTDVYALGVLLFEVLTGAPPAVGIVSKPSSKRGDLPQAVDQVILKAMAQSPDQRFQTTLEVQQAFQKALQSPAEAAIPAEPAPPPAGVSQSVNVQQPKGTNWLAIILGIILIGVLIGGAIWLVPRLTGGDEVADQPEVPPIEQPTEPPVEQPPVEQPPVEEPTDPPGDGPGFELPEGLPDFCYSVVGTAGIAVFGIAAVAKKHKRETYDDD